MNSRVTCGVAALGLSSLCGSAACAQLPSGNWGLMFGDEFSETTLDRDRWNPAYPWGRTHNYPAYIRDENISVSGGTLNLQAKRENFGGQPFTSGAVNTKGLLDFHGGYIEARMKLPAFLGAWPAFWALQDGWPPELDIMEARYRNDYDGDYDTGYGDMYQYVGTYHWGADYTQAKSAGTGFKYTGQNLTAGFHNYGTLWANDHVEFYFDGQSMGSVYSSQANIAQMQNMYLLLNLGVGGWPGDPPGWADLSPQFQIDWVRVWQQGGGRSDFKAAASGFYNWDDANLWTAGAPKLSNQEAWFGNTAAGDARLDWNATKTIGTLSFNTPTNYTLGYEDDQLSLGGVGTASASLNVYNQGGQGRVTLSSRVELASTLVVRNYTANPVTFTADVHGTGGLTLEAGKTQINGRAFHTGGTRVTGTGELIVNGALDTPAALVEVGMTAGANAKLTVQGNGVINANNIALANNGGRATYAQSAGAVNVASFFTVGFGANSTASATVAGGTLSVRTRPGTDGDLEVGTFGNGTGALSVTGGTVRLLNNANLALGSRNNSGAGTVTQSGGTVAFYSDGGVTPGGGSVFLGRPGAGATGTYAYNLNGGTLRAGKIQGGATRSTFNFNGGTLAATSGNANWISGVGAVNVLGGGAKIDSNGKSVTIAPGLLKSGAGAAGGLTKLGAGTLRLAGVNTYGGVTTVSKGTLIVNGTIKGSAVNVPAGSTLGGSGRIEPTTLISVAGNLAPGDGFGWLDTTSVKFGAGGNLLLDLGGYSAATIDRVIVNGKLDYGTGAKLVLKLANSFSPKKGDRFDFLDFKSTGGRFASVSLPTLATGLKWDTSALYNKGVLSVTTGPGVTTFGLRSSNYLAAAPAAVPEPAAAGVLLMGTAALLRRRRVAR